MLVRGQDLFCPTFGSLGWPRCRSSLARGDLVYQEQDRDRDHSKGSLDRGRHGTAGWDSGEEEEEPRMGPGRLRHGNRESSNYLKS